MGRRYDTIVFLSDYGTVDEFVGVCKAVIRELAPHVVVIDLTHEIPPHDVRAGALTLARAVSWLPECVVLAVVDPGVGTRRRPVAVEVADGRGIFVGPDNGLLSPAVSLAGGATAAVELDGSQRLASPGATFDGRDLFAPVAARLCSGADLSAVGRSVNPASLVPMTIGLPRVEDGRITAEVLWIDRFGNCQLNVGPDEVPAQEVTVMAGGRTRRARVVRAFGDLERDELGLVVDSTGLLALALNRLPASADLDLRVGSEVTLVLPEGDAVVPEPRRTRHPGGSR